MKLVDLLIKHNVQWPAGATSVWQGPASGTLYWRDYEFTAPVIIPEIAQAAGSSFPVTKEEYDAALAKHKAKWVRNYGRKNVCPCQSDRKIELRFRSGSIHLSLSHHHLLFWGHYKVNSDIMAWRYV